MTNNDSLITALLSALEYHEFEKVIRRLIDELTKEDELSQVADLVQTVADFDLTLLATQLVLDYDIPRELLSLYAGATSTRTYDLDL